MPYKFHLTQQHATITNLRNVIFQVSNKFRGGVHSNNLLEVAQQLKFLIRWASTKMIGAKSQNELSHIFLNESQIFSDILNSAD